MEPYIHGNPQITFLKSVYKRGVNVFATKKEYKINPISNTIVFDELHTEYLDIINKIWIEKQPGIKRLSLMLVPYHKVNNVPDRAFSKQQLEKAKTLDEILNIPDVKLISSFTPDTVEFFNSYNDKNPLPTQIRLPLDNLAFVIQCLNRANYLLVLHTERHVGHRFSINLIVKYLTSKDETEIARFNNVAHEYLTRRFIEVNKKVKQGENKLDIDMIGSNIGTVVIKSPVDLIDLEISDDAGSTYNFICSEKNPEHYYKSDKYKFYVLNQLDEHGLLTFKSDQPGSTYTLSKTHKLKFLNISEPVDISIGYVIFDVHQYSLTELNLLLYKKQREQNANIQFAPRFAQLVEQPERITEEAFQNEITMWFNSNPLVTSHWSIHIESNYEIFDYDKYLSAHRLAHPNVPEPVNPPEPAQPAEPVNPAQPADPDNPAQPNPPVWIPIKKPGNQTERFFELYHDLIAQVIESVEKTQAIKQKLEPEDICELLFHQFEPNEYYYSCGTCKGKFSIECYKQWIHDNTKSGKCPKCLTYMEKIPQMYQNC